VPTSRGDLSEACRRVCDEWVDLAEYAQLASEIEGSRTPNETAVVLSTLMTARSLIGFLAGDGQGRWKPDDLKANDFLQTHWHLPQADDCEIRGYLPVLNKNLFHLTWTNLDAVVLLPATFVAHLVSWYLNLFVREAEHQAVPNASAFRAAADTVAARLPPKSAWGMTPVPPARPRVVRPGRACCA
jgi:hypothetical protein